MSSVSLINRSSHDGRAWLPWLAGWGGASVLGVVNGMARQFLYGSRMGKQPAHFTSTASLIVILAVYMLLLERRWPLPNRSTALGVGAAWAVLTVLFEFGFGHYVAGDSWSSLLEQYDVSRGHIWVVIPLGMATGPAVVREIHER